MKFLKALALGLILLSGLLIIGALSFRAVVQFGLGREEKIKTLNGIDEARFVNVRGAQEWITLRGESKSNPVILFLHGGPSQANSPLVSFYRGFEQDYVFVQWDQPGAGKTYIKAGRHQPPLTLDSMSDDGVALAELLAHELHQKKIILIGQDFGGLLGLKMIQKRPELFFAFVGTGQTVSLQAGFDVLYRQGLDRATGAKDTQRLTALKKIGPPPYRSIQQASGLQECCRQLPPDDAAGVRHLTGSIALSPYLSISELFGWYRALRTGEPTLDARVFAMPDLRSTDTRFAVPVFFIQGADDNVTPTELVVDYAAHIQAPAKRVSVIPSAGHFVMWTHEGSFLKELTADLRTAGVARPADTDDAPK